MTKRYKIILIFCSFTLSILFASCPFMEQLPRNDKYLEFELSKENIKINEPIELKIKLCFPETDYDTIYAIKLLDNVEMNLCEGVPLKYEDKKATIVKFIQPENQSETLTPYCKFTLNFKKAGSYVFYFRRTNEEQLCTDFGVNSITYTIDVSE